VGECDRIIGDVDNIARYARSTLSLSEEDIERVCRLWRSHSTSDRREFVSRAIGNIAGLIPESHGGDMAGIVEKLLASLEAICENADTPAVSFLLTAAKAIVNGLSLSALSLVIAKIAGMMLSRASSEEEKLSVFKYSMWCLTVLVSSYNMIKTSILMKASGISPTALENLVLVYSRDLEERIRGTGAGGA